MNLIDKRVLITGGAGGIGYALAEQLLDEGARVLLAGRDAQALRAALARLGADPDRAASFVADLTYTHDRKRLCAHARHWEGGIDILVNNAGTSHFGLLEDSLDEDVEDAIATNLLAPIDLCRQLVQHLRARREGQIVNIGSALGSIGLAGNATYCATKFGLRGFTEALLRELDDSTVRICYFAPRATSTSINSPAAQAVNKELGVAVDSPDAVATQIIHWMRRDCHRGVIGWPEKLFVRLNALFPSLVDRALRSQLPIVRKHARGGRAAPSRPLTALRQVN